MNSDFSSEEKRLRLDLLVRGGFKFLSLTPERFFGANARELALLRPLRPSYFVVDEAHCTDRWEQDLQPEYGQLGEARERLDDPPVLAFTATAGRETQVRILSSLGVAEAEVFVPTRKVGEALAAALAGYGVATPFSRTATGAREAGPPAALLRPPRAKALRIKCVHRGRGEAPPTGHLMWGIMW